MMPWSLGLMSGTSMDGVDAALIRTDGIFVEAHGPFLSLPYPLDIRHRLGRAVGARRVKPEATSEDVELERAITQWHVQAVERLLAEGAVAREDVAVIGFHGHTLFHDPAHGVTRQIGDGGLLARETGIGVVGDFRANDVAHGGQGAPLAPLYHRALAEPLTKPVAVLNIGGVANVTWIDGDDILAFDTGPGNALIDDWTARVIGRPMDEGGRLARAGHADEALIDDLMGHPYFARMAPKSLDRDEFAAVLERLDGVDPADGAATLTHFSVRAMAHARRAMPKAPHRWLVCGGGRRNGCLMEALNRFVTADPVEAVGWDGDALEAQAFAFLAQRSLRKLALSVPGTTGVATPLSGGVYHQPP
ncbi:anhydro-N-acetylmuramic acid kinase [Varunaivibrio sulfuroxidans]|uniref:Anhydro-N-acetylmuramic acid kinase n=1 Tax=Varunaivibrio sulfuroxidans TaxID=1773489 RepID=A0A4R3J9B9_9PROT|nr:anhydro-N-acetylmuramic acid kinase [Varunaivibrio sulfuroxidans]